MSIVSRVIKKRKPKSEPIKQYDNPKKDGLYRICLNDECQTMFKIDDDKSRAAFCWSCYLRVLRSGHYLGPHMTHPPYKYFDDAVAEAIKGKSEPKPIKVITPVVKSKPTVPFELTWKICKCGRRFKMKTTRQKRCNTCLGSVKGKRD